jgi:hypothetical protein
MNLSTGSAGKLSGKCVANAAIEGVISLTPAYWMVKSSSARNGDVLDAGDGPPGALTT